MSTKVIKNPTNVQIVTELCKQNPTASYSKLVGYDAKTGKIDENSLSRFADEPVIANEFISAMANKIVVQRAYDLFRDYEMPFGMFRKEMSRLGDAEELLTASLQTAKDYSSIGTQGNPVSPFDATKPTILLSWIKTEDKKYVDVQLVYEVWSGAFTSETGLSNISGIILKNLRDAIELMVYDAITQELSNYYNIAYDSSKGGSDQTYVQLTQISGYGETANAQKAYEQIMEIAKKMTLPSRDFNKSGERTLTPRGRAVLFLNAKYSASFDINVLASLFNSDKIGTDRYFKDVIIIDTPEVQDPEDPENPLANVVGFIMDEEAFMWGYRFVVTDSIRNPKTLAINTYYHAWVKRAFVPWRNCVELIDNEY